MLLTLDTETRGMWGKIFKIGIYSEIGYISKYSFSDCIPYLRTYAKDFELHIYIHYAEFDVSKLITEIIQNEYEIDFNKSIFINNKVVTLTVKNLCIFHDSFHILKSSLDSLCKSFGIDKEYAKYDLTQHILESGYAIFDDDTEMFDLKKSKGNYFELVDPDEPILNYYLKLDCISLYKLLQITLEVTEITLDDFVKCPTMPSLAMKVYKTKFSKDYDLCTKAPRKFFGETGELVESICRQGYYGGRVEVFAPTLKNGHHYDVNSLFAHEQESNLFPVGFYKLHVGKQAQITWNYFLKTHNGGGFVHCVVNVPKMHIPPLPYKAFGKLLFPCGKLEGVWAFPELENSLKYGVEILEIKQIVFFQEMADIFSNYVSTFKKIKMSSTGAKRQFAKDFLTNLYGKFGMRRERTTFVNESEKDKLDKKGIQYVEHTYDKLGISFLEKVTVSRAEYIQPQIAAYVTSYSRIHLLNEGLIPMYEKGLLAYCDTDSAAGEGELDDEYVHDTEFGKWKKESDIDKAIFLQPKFYAESTSWNEKGKKLIAKGKGIPSEILGKLKFNDYEDYLKHMLNGDLDRLFIFDGKVDRNKLITAMKSNISTETQRISKKSINLLSMQKRIIDYQNNTSYPHILNSDNIDNTYYARQLSVFNETLKSYDYDSDCLFELVKANGKIRIPKCDELGYDKYIDMSDNRKRLCYSKTGLHLKQWLKKANVLYDDFIYL